MVLFRIGWWVLLASTLLFALNHLVGAATFAASADERVMFLIFGALNLLALVVVIVPYRARERWAWWATWIPVAAMFIGPIVFGPGPITAIYLVGGGIMILAQLMTAGRMLTGREAVPSETAPAAAS